jgi:hypothetical protein
MKRMGFQLGIWTGFIFMEASLLALHAFEAPAPMLPQIEAASWDEHIPGALNLKLAESGYAFDLEIYELRLDSMELKALGFQETEPYSLFKKQVVLNPPSDKQKRELLLALRLQESIVSLYWIK